MNIKTFVWPWLKFAKFCVDILCYPIFLLRGTPPHTIGYQFYKRRMIQRYLSPKVFQQAINLNHYGLHLDERIIEYPWLFSHLTENGGSLLDAGSALNHGFLLGHEGLARKKIFISTLSPEAYCYWRRGISYVFEDLRQTCYCEGFFDWVVCISTIEHIGLDNYKLYTKDQSKLENRKDDYLRVICEMHRVLKPGGKLFLTFPFGKYRNHGWFQVFDVGMVEKIRQAFAPMQIEESFFKYEAAGWRKAKSEELQDSEFFDVHATPRLDPDHAAAARGLACLELTK